MPDQGRLVWSRSNAGGPLVHMRVRRCPLCLHQPPPHRASGWLHLVASRSAGGCRMLSSAADRTLGLSQPDQEPLGLSTFCWLSATLALTGSTDTLLPFHVLHPVPAWSVSSVVYALCHFDNSHARTVAVLWAISGQPASVSPTGEPSGSCEFLPWYKGARGGSGLFVLHLDRGTTWEMAFPHSPEEEVTEASFSAFLLLHYNPWPV